MKKYIYILMIFFSIPLLAQKEGDVIINEIGNNGTKKALYTGGDYVELLVVNEGVKLGGWYLSDLSNPNGTPKETEGSIKFSDGEKSVFNQVIPKGTYILICLGDKEDRYGTDAVEEDLSFTDGNNRIVVFAYSSPDNVTPGEGKIVITGKDNMVLTSEWNKKKAVDAISWEGSCTWEGCTLTQLPLEALDNGHIVYFKPAGGIFHDNTSPDNWISITNSKEASPGAVNIGVDDSSLKNK